MRIKSIQLSWFRGAADPISLESDDKSIVIYGENGSGKSSFVDAVEYSISDGKIGHLSHEQSGKRQEKGIPNTHTPENQKTGFNIKFKDNTEFKVQIKRDGSATKSGTGGATIEKWDYRRTVLRQDEVARFIQNTKGEKYSALLPLLGLQHLEIAADNLRKLAKSVEKESKLEEIKGELNALSVGRKAVFGSENDEQISNKITHLHAKHCPNKATTTGPVLCCKELNAALDKNIARSSADQRQHLILNDVSELRLIDDINAIRLASEKLAIDAEPLITEKLQVLESSADFAAKLDKQDKINCPACGQEVSKNNFQSHVANERVRLEQIISTFEARKESIRALCDNVKLLKTGLTKAEIKLWRDELVDTPLAGNFIQLNNFDPNSLLSSCRETDLKIIETEFLPLIKAAEKTAKNAPVDVQQLTVDKKHAETALAIFESKKKAEFVAQVGIIKTFIGALEEATRKEIGEQSATVIKAISKDIQIMWGVLHPDEHIEHVRLHVPQDTEKAIDVCLKFHGIDQDTPRLTLSEGFRNSLGLCIFLAMARREATSDDPIFLDDVVVSVDRNHRGMIVGLLEQMFADRQLIILTHDRDWFVDLKQHLNKNSWFFKALMPYDSPTVGIRWSEKTFGFDDARKHVNTDPDLAGNTARKIMDTELALRAERLKIRLPYLHRERNDHRTGHEFLSQIIEDGKNCFQKKDAKEYIEYADGLTALRDADKLLISWANRASHTLDVTKSEATKLIDACEKALAAFDCSACKKSISKLEDAKAEFVQCDCGNIRWRYGKG